MGTTTLTSSVDVGRGGADGERTGGPTGAGGWGAGVVAGVGAGGTGAAGMGAATKTAALVVWFVFVVVANVRAVFVVVVGAFVVVVGAAAGAKAGVGPTEPPGGEDDVATSDSPALGTGLDEGHVAAQVQVQVQVCGAVGPAPCLEIERSVPQTVNVQAQSHAFEDVGDAVVFADDGSGEVTSAEDGSAELALAEDASAVEGVDVAVPDRDGSSAADASVPDGAFACMESVAEVGASPAVFGEVSQVQFHDQSQAQLDAV